MAKATLLPIDLPSTTMDRSELEDLMTSSYSLCPVTPESMAKHVPPPVKFIQLTTERIVAYRKQEGRSPTLLYVPGYLSTMNIHKATAIEQYAKEKGLASIRYDQEGTGQSTGDLKTILFSDYVEDALAMVDSLCDGPVIIVASSMGGWISSYVATVRPSRIAGLILIGPGFNYPDKKMKDAIGKGLVEEETMRRYNNNEPLPFTTPYGDSFFRKAYVESSVKFELDFKSQIKVQCPVRILHAYEDNEADWKTSLKLFKQVESPHVDLILRKSGNHRLMKPRDLTLLVYTVDRLVMEHDVHQDRTPDRANAIQNFGIYQVKREKSKL